MTGHTLFLHCQFRGKFETWEETAKILIPQQEQVWISTSHLQLYQTNGMGWYNAFKNEHVGQRQSKSSGYFRRTAVCSEIAALGIKQKIVLAPGMGYYQDNASSQKLLYLIIDA